MIDAATFVQLGGSLLLASGVLYTARSNRGAATEAVGADREAKEQARLDLENARQFTALRAWTNDLQQRFEALEARFEVQAGKLRDSEDRVYALEREVHDGQHREREMKTTIVLLEARLQQVQSRQS